MENYIFYRENVTQKFRKFTSEDSRRIG